MPPSPYPLQALMKQVDQDATVELLRALIAIPSVNPFDDPAAKDTRELEIADYYQATMDDLGLLTSRRDVIEGRPNIFGRIKGRGDGPCIMLAGHLDTVGVVGYHDPFDPVIKRGRVYGRGSCDMKAGLAAFIEVARTLLHNDIELAGDLLIAGIADEEHHMIGSREIRQNGPIPDFAIVGEPTELEVCHAHKGQLCMHIRTYGKACHSSVPELGINAIANMSKAIEAFEDYNDELKARPAHPVCGHGRFSPGVIRGGDIASSVPDFCELEVDRRTIVGESLDDVVSEYRQRLDPLAAQIPGFRYDIGPATINNDALDTPEDSPIVEQATEAFRQTLGRAPALAPFSGGTDAPNLLCPAVICGPGSIQQAHTLDEFVEIDQLTQAVKIYLRSILALQQVE
ncbi:MAG: M20 family metallopeptidase [Gammaproteobacteria bacterium]|jgi:acetylornithine deacetylase/succinyl-diaminopimelate desuccinylase family protein